MLATLTSGTLEYFQGSPDGALSVWVLLPCVVTQMVRDCRQRGIIIPNGAASGSSHRVALAMLIYRIMELFESEGTLKII